MPVHPAFASSGKKPGLEIWRIEDFEPVPVPASHHGNFYSGDSYIVLSTSGSGSRLSWDIHFWLGSQTSQDEAGAAAVLTVNLDDEQFQGSAVQHREKQGHESKEFLEYFEPVSRYKSVRGTNGSDGTQHQQRLELGMTLSPHWIRHEDHLKNHLPDPEAHSLSIRYLDGGHASGFSHVTINPGAEKRLFQIKGKRNVRVKQVAASASSLNKGDCFILDVNHDIFVYVGEKAKSMERLKAITVANQIKAQDHNGRATIEIIDADSNQADNERFFEALGSGDQDSVADASEGGDDEEFERGSAQEISLSEISDSSGSMAVKKLNKPFTQDMLNTKECYILDTGSYSGIYVWVGRESNEKEKAEAMNKAKQYLKTRDYPDWVHVSKVPEGVESTAFKQCFQDWN